MARRALTTAPPDTASLYVRLSREAGEANLSRDGMLADVDALAARLGLRVVARHVDDGLSGAVRNRPEFLGWLDDARAGRVSTLIAWHVDRMTREGVNVAALILDTIEGKDPETGRVIREPVRLLDTKGLDSLGDEAAFRFRFVIAAEVARAERERMRDRARAAQRRARAAGRFPGGTVPYGFRAVDNPDGAGRVLVVDEAEAAVLREAATRLFSGETLSAVVRYLNASLLAPRRAASWSRVTARQALQTEAAAALFSPAERRLLTQTLAVRSPDARKGGRHPSRLLSGLLRCHACDARLQVARRTDGSVTYRCQSGAEGRPCPAPVSVSAPAIETVVADLWRQGWGSLAETVVAREADERADRLALLADEIDEALAEVARTRGPERLAALERLETLEAEQTASEAAPVSTLSTIRETGRTYADAWDASALPERRALLLRTTGRLTLLPGRRGPRGFDPARLSDPERLDPALLDAREPV